MFLVFRMANSNLLIFLRFQYSLINTFVKGDSLSPILEDALPFCPFGTFPHTVGNHPAELSQLDRSCLRLICCSHSSIKKPLCEFLLHSGSSSCYFIPYKFLTCPVLPRFHWYPATFLPVHNLPVMLPRSGSLHKHHFLHGSDSVR